MAEIRNAYIFVADALRWDFLPDSVAAHGSVLKSVASSTLSPTSFASLTSGLYPPTHGVRTFEHRLDPDRNFLLTSETHSTSLWQSSDEDPLYSVLGQAPTESQRVDEMEPPFINIEREILTHAPYGMTEDESGQQSEAMAYLDDESANLAALREYYERGADRAASVFDERLDSLDERGVLDETLVVFTSDHGELLGEYGSLSHVYPLVPEAVYVPTVIVRPDGVEPNDRSVFSHVDVPATVADVLDIDIPYEAPGTTAYEPTEREGAYAGFEFPAGYGAFGESDSRLDQYASRVHSLWDENGGWVFNDSPRRAQIRDFVKYVLPTSQRRRNVLRQNVRGVFALLGQVFSQTTCFGTPAFSRDRARQLIEEIPRSGHSPGRSRLGEEQRDRLEHLGYR